MMAARGVTVSNLVPVMLQRMLAAAPGCGFTGGSAWCSPAAPHRPPRCARSSRPSAVRATYGLTETSPYLTLSVLEPKHRGSARRSSPGCTGGPETVELRPG